MIDFVSTHPHAHPQTVACARLLTSVIVQAIRDATVVPNSKERKAETNLDINALHAIEFLFNDESLFPKYAAFVGINPEGLRRGLLETSGPGLDDRQRRALRVRLHWYHQLILRTTSARKQHMEKYA